MPQCQVTIEVAAPREATFEIYSDLTQSEARIEGIQRLEILTEGPIDAGTRWRETRTMFGKEASEEMEITSFEPPRAYEVTAESHGSAYHTRFDFEPSGPHTRVTMTFSATPKSLSSRVMTMLLGRWMMETVEKVMRRDMEDLKRVAEGGSPCAVHVKPG